MGVASAEEETQAVMKVYSKEDYSVVNRFESEWTYYTELTVNATPVAQCSDVRQRWVSLDCWTNSIPNLDTRF